MKRRFAHHSWMTPNFTHKWPLSSHAVGQHAMRQPYCIQLMYITSWAAGRCSTDMLALRDVQSCRKACSACSQKGRVHLPDTQLGQAERAGIAHGGGQAIAVLAQGCLAMQLCIQHVGLHGRQKCNLPAHHDDRCTSPLYASTPSYSDIHCSLDYMFACRQFSRWLASCCYTYKRQATALKQL